MDKKQEILAISRLVFDLTRLDGGDLDGMLARLNDLLTSLPGIRVLPHSLVLLRNSRGLLLQWRSSVYRHRGCVSTVTVRPTI